MTNALRLLFVALVGLFVVVACENTASTETADQTDRPIDNPNAQLAAFELAIAPPIQGVDVAFESYTVSTQEAQTITTPTGTQLHIPANAFVDADGNLVEGEVTIRYREFHSAKDIIASGIPMHEPETGDYMETAGMFEIRGDQGGKELFIRADNNIQVDMVSQVDGDQFNFYQLGPKDCRWQEKGTAKPKPNLAKAKAIAALNRQLETTAQQWRTPEQAKNMVFDMNVNYSKVPALKAFKNVLWEYAGKGPNPEKNEWIFDVAWDDAVVELTDAGTYQLTLTAPEKTYTTQVRPILSGKDQEKALALFRESTAKQYEQIKKEQEDEQKRVDLMGNFVRSYQVENFGVCNWDTWIRRQQQNGGILCKLNPQFDGQTSDYVAQNPTKISYFHVKENRRSVVRYSNDLFSYFLVQNPHEASVLLAVLPDGRVAMCGADAMIQASTNATEKAPLTIPLVTIKEKVTSANDLGDLIEQAFAS